jgi:hypothetical protein
LLNADKSDSGYITRDQYSGGNQHKIEQTHGGPPPLNGSTSPIDTDGSDAGKDDPTNEPTNKNHCQFSAQCCIWRAYLTSILETELDADAAAIAVEMDASLTHLLVVPIVNPIRWRLIENRAMLPLDVGFVQTDLWGGDRSATVARNA